MAKIAPTVSHLMKCMMINGVYRGNITSIFFTITDPSVASPATTRPKRSLRWDKVLSLVTPEQNVQINKM